MESLLHELEDIAVKCDLVRSLSDDVVTERIEDSLHQVTLFFVLLKGDLTLNHRSFLHTKLLIYQKASEHLLLGSGLLSLVEALDDLFVEDFSPDGNEEVLGVDSKSL